MPVGQVPARQSQARSLVVTLHSACAAAPSLSMPGALPTPLACPRAQPGLSARPERAAAD